MGRDYGCVIAYNGALCVNRPNVVTRASNDNSTDSGSQTATPNDNSLGNTSSSGQTTKINTQQPTAIDAAIPSSQSASGSLLSEHTAVLSQAIDQCLQKDRHILRRKLQQLAKSEHKGESIDRGLQQLIQRIENSHISLTARQAAVPETISYPEQLPIAGKREQIAKAISEHQVVVIAGETGSGKTTQLPKICLELGRGVNAMIGHTQPRRLAARTVAQRIADELNTPLGEGVGYQVRFNDQVSDTSHIKLMTDGILLAEIQNDRYLNQYDTIIIDEAHERSLNIDFLLGYLKQLLPKRPDLKLIITSATIDLERFSKHFDDAPIIEVSGRSFPVEVLYRPLEDLSDDGSLAPGIAVAIEEILHRDKQQGGDILVFLSGEADIREVSRYLRDQEWRHTEILPLYARLSNSEQNKIFSLTKRAGRRIILATNVAETSLTVPGIRYVIDPGEARISRYSYRTKIQRLPIEPISQASANQRKGRCGRVADGVCVRLYSEQDFDSRSEFTDPEIQRTNLASVILKMLSMRIGEVQHFPFVDPPDHRMISDGFKLLQELGAVDHKQQLSQRGRVLAKFPIDPRFSRMLIAAAQSNCLTEMLIICSALSVQDPRERPADKRQASDEKHRRFWHEHSDFLSYVNLWQHYEEQRQELTQNKLRQYCKRNFLSFMKMREWRDIHHQLRIVVKDLGLKENSDAASDESVHRALLSGLLSHIATLDQDKVYLGARNRKLRIFPGSALFKKSPKWLMAAEIAETTQVYARCNARIQPEWLLGINDSLFKHHYSEPHWQQKTGRVMAFESLSLYGLVIRDRNKIHYGPIDPVESRQIFIRSALVEGHYKCTLPFYKHNQKLLRDIDDLEAKSRRRDILVDEQVLFQFYDDRLDADVTTARAFESWYKKHQTKQPRLLFLDSEKLMQHSAGNVTENQFPGRLHCADLQLKLSYLFEPGNAHDGVTVTIPVALLNRVPVHHFEWLVPGMLRDKCIALLKLLPKSLRKQMVPVPEYVDKALRGVEADNVPLLETLARQLRKIVGVEIPLDQWRPEKLDNFYRMNFRIVDTDGKTLGQSRDIDQLIEQFKGRASESVQQQTEQRFHKADIKQWDFGELPEQYDFKQAGVAVTSYPALIDKDDSVTIELMDFAGDAELASQRGLVRLLMLQLPQQLKYLRKELLKGNQINLQLAGINQRREDWIEDLLFAVFMRVFIEGRPLPRNQQDFDRRLNDHKAELVELATRGGELLIAIAKQATVIRKGLKSANQLAWAMAVGDIKHQLDRLFMPGYIADTPWHWLEQYPRYLQAIAQRIEKLRGQLPRDRQLMVGLEALSVVLQDHWQNNRQAAIKSELLLDYRWLLEEYRVSLFAQQLGTLQPVSEKRLKALLVELKQALINKKA